MCRGSRTHSFKESLGGDLGVARPIFKRKELPKSERVLVIHRDKLTCVECGESLFLNPDSAKLTILNGAFHHIIPLIYGGENKAHNVCLLCTLCHNEIHSGSEIREKYFGMYEAFVRNGKLR